LIYQICYLQYKYILFIKVSLNYFIEDKKMTLKNTYFNIYDYNSLTLNKSGNYDITKLYFESYKNNNINF